MILYFFSVPEVIFSVYPSCFNLFFLYLFFFRSYFLVLSCWFLCSILFLYFAYTVLRILLVGFSVFWTVV